MLPFLSMSGGPNVKRVSKSTSCTIHVIPFNVKCYSQKYRSEFLQFFLSALAYVQRRTEFGVNLLKPKTYIMYHQL